MHNISIYIYIVLQTLSTNDSNQMEITAINSALLSNVPPFASLTLPPQLFHIFKRIGSSITIASALINVSKTLSYYNSRYFLFYVSSIQFHLLLLIIITNVCTCNYMQILSIN